MILAVIIVYLVGMLAIGLYASSKVKTAGDYLMGGYSMGIVPMTGTYLATFFSALSLLGGVGLIYTVGIGGSWLPMTWALGSALGPIIALRFRRVKVVSPPEYFYRRFGSRKLQSFGALMTIIGLMFNLIVQFSAMGVVWTLATGRSFNEGLIIGSVIAIIYTMAGGFFAVVWTDVVQSVVFLVTISIGAVAVITKIGGVGEIYQAAASISTLPVVDAAAATVPGSMLSLLGPYTALAMFFTFLVQGPGTGTNPVYLQRIQASKNMKVALGMYKYAWIILIFVYIALNIVGVGGRVLIPTMPEGMKTDWIMPLLFQQLTHPIICGLFFAGLMAAAMSTIDSNIIIISSCVTIDIARNIWPDIKEEKLVWISRTVVAVVGVIVVIMAMSNMKMLILVAGYAFGVLGLTYFIPMLLGLYWKRANLIGAWSCILGGGLVFIIWQAAVGTSAYGIPPIGVGILAGAFFMWIVSLLTPPCPETMWGPYFKKKGSQTELPYE